MYNAVGVRIARSILFGICVVAVGCDSANQTGTYSKTVTFKNGQLTLGSATISLPTKIEQLTVLLGKPDRTSRSVNVIYTWDKLGIYAYEKPDSGQVNSVVFSYRRKSDFKFHPRLNFAGKIVLLGGELDAKSSKKDLTRAGLSVTFLPIVYRAEVPPHSIFAEYRRGRLQHVAFEWTRK